MRRVFVCVSAVLMFLLVGAVNVRAAESVTLAWDANTEPDVAGYIVEYGTVSRQYSQSVQLGLVTQTTISGLQPSTTYYFAVRAYNASNVLSPHSNEVVYTTQPSGTSTPPTITDALSRVGNSVAWFAPGTVVRGSDTAYDPANDVFLVVFGDGPIHAAFVDATGMNVTPFFTLVNNSATPAYFPRATYSPHANNGAGGQGAFLVTWHQTVGSEKQVFARLVSYLAPGRIASATRQISDNAGGSSNESGPVVAYSATSRKFLIAWKTAQSAIRGRFVDAFGTVIGSSVQLEATGASYPSVAWNGATNEFGLAYVGSDASGKFAAFRRVAAADGTASSRSTFGFAPAVHATGIDVNTVTRNYVIVWALGPGTMSATFDQFGTALGTNYVTDRLGYANSLGLTFNETTGTFLVVSSDRDSLEVGAIELRGNGAPNTGVGAVTSGATIGSFHPLAAARTGTARWHIAYSLDRVAIASQIVASSSLGGGSSTAPPPSGPPAPSGVCTTGDPFASLGGGVCCNGGWLPPGMACSVVSAPPPPSSSPTPPPPAPPPPSAPPSGTGSTGAACTTSNPFASLGGGTCCNGGWLPPGMACSFAASTAPTAPPPSGTPTAPPPPPPAPTGAGSGAACTTSDPFGSLGGGTCCNGGWLPPGMSCSVVAAPPASSPPPTGSPTPTPPPPSAPPTTGGVCSTSDPFKSLGGGTCCMGGWLPPGMACTVR